MVTPAETTSRQPGRAAGWPQRGRSYPQFRRQRLFDPHRAEVKDFDAERVLGERKLLKSANRAHRFALAAAEQALRDAESGRRQRRPSAGVAWSARG